MAMKMVAYKFKMMYIYIKKMSQRVSSSTKKLKKIYILK